jgi:hypothetical protein
MSDKSHSVKQHGSVEKDPRAGTWRKRSFFLLPSPSLLLPVPEDGAELHCGSPAFRYHLGVDLIELRRHRHLDGIKGELSEFLRKEALRDGGECASSKCFGLKTAPAKRQFLISSTRPLPLGTPSSSFASCAS